MRIGIDARFYGLEHAGIGRYVIELVANLRRIDRKNTYVLFLRPPYDKDLVLPDHWEKVATKIKHYTVEEQWLLAEIFARQGLDLLHVPHFNVPLLYRGPFVVTIHDLLWHEVKGLSVTTQNPLFYLLKYLGYRAVVSHALRQARRVFVPSQVIREKLVRWHGVAQGAIVVTPEAPSSIFKPVRKKPEILKKYRLTTPFFIYTGSVYPHKNIPVVASAIKRLNEQGERVRFVVVSARSVFLDRLRQELFKMGAGAFVQLVGFVPDDDLVSLYAQAVALVQPSYSEGFGLTGLEAMACGTPVIASRIPVFTEIYSDAALLVDPYSPEHFASAMKKLLHNRRLQVTYSQRGRIHVRSFSWKNLARTCQEVYENSS